MSSNAHHVLSQCMTRLRLLYSRSITRKCYVFMKLLGNYFRILHFALDSVCLEGFLKSSEGFYPTSMLCSLLCSVNLFPKYFILAVQLKKTAMRSDNAAVSGSIADCSNFMSVCKQMQVRLKKRKVHQPGTKEISGKHVAK